MRAIDLTGRTFGRLTVLHFVEARLDSGNHSRRIYRVRCECGVEKEVPSGALLGRQIVSCGCFMREVVTAMRTKHGHARRPGKSRDSSEYGSWRAMKDRCTNPRFAQWKDYGGRGITVFGPWLESFAVFFAYMGPKPTPAHTIDRIDPNGDYEPGNVRWATRIEQAANTRAKFDRAKAAELIAKHLERKRDT